jgi:phosphoribosylanthranilate isomerase
MPQSSTTGPYRLEAVKICGLTGAADRDLVANAGADYFGALVDVGFSPRSITLEQAMPLFDSPPIPGVVLFSNASLDRVKAIVEQLKPFAVQLLGHEQPELIASLKSALDCQVWKSLHVPPRNHGEIDLESVEMLAEEYEDSGVDVLLFTTVDYSGATRFGTGMVGDWSTIRDLMRPRVVPGFLAGGLNPGNVASALQAVKPNGIDVCTGVESSPGKIDPQRLKEFFEALTTIRG